MPVGQGKAVSIMNLKSNGEGTNVVLFSKQSESWLMWCWPAGPYLAGSILFEGLQAQQYKQAFGVNVK